MNSRLFSIAVDKAFDDIIQKQFLPFKQKIAMEVLTRVTEKMPVDTGRARGNTIVSIGSLSAEFSDTTDRNGAVTVSSGAGVIFSDRDPYSIVFVQNNLPYINKLENGHSNQAPLGMFELTTQEIEVIFL